MTEKEFTDYWHARLVGMALTGLVLDIDEKVKGPMEAGRRATELPDKVGKMLAQMWKMMQPAAPNGVAKPRG